MWCLWLWFFLLFLSSKTNNRQSSLGKNTDERIGYWSEFKRLLVIIILSPFSNTFLFIYFATTTRPITNHTILFYFIKHNWRFFSSNYVFFFICAADDLLGLLHVQFIYLNRQRSAKMRKRTVFLRSSHLKSVCVYANGFRCYMFFFSITLVLVGLWWRSSNLLDRMSLKRLWCVYASNAWLSAYSKTKHFGFRETTDEGNVATFCERSKEVASQGSC